MNFCLDKYKGKYRVKSLRLKNYDYSNSGAYFVTICTRDRIKYFGKIKNNQAHLNCIGRIIDCSIFKISQKFNFVFIDRYVVMPNHIHLILFIDWSEIFNKNIVEARLIAPL